MPTDQPARGPLPEVLAALVVGPHDHLVLNFTRLDHAAVQAIRQHLEQYSDLADRILVVEEAEMALIHARPAPTPPAQRIGQ